MNEPSSAQSRLLRVLQEALTWLVPLLLFVHIRLKVLYQSRDLMHGEEELTQGILGHHLIYGRLAPFMAYQHTQDAGGTLHTGLFSYIPFSLVDLSLIHI